MHASARRLAPPFVISLLFALCFVGIFTAALHSPKPHDIPVGIVAPAPVLDAVRGGLAQHAAGAFDLRSYPDEERARAAIDDRTIDGALVVTGNSVTLLVAGASGDAAAGAITNAFSAVTANLPHPLAIQTLHPFPAYDSHGLAAFFLVVGLVIASILFIATSFIITQPTTVRAWLIPLTVFSIVAGLVGPLISALAMWAWPVNFWPVAGLSALLCLAMTSITAALLRLVGLPGVGLAILSLVMVGNSAAGGPVSYRFLPDFYRQLSQYLPAGATVTALRSALYFDNAALAAPLVVLIGWTVVGVGGIVAPGRRGGGRTGTHLQPEPAVSRV